MVIDPAAFDGQHTHERSICHTLWLLYAGQVAFQNNVIMPIETGAGG